MTKHSGTAKPRTHGLAKVVKQMDSWIEHETDLKLLISGPLVPLMFFGRLVARQDGVFLFDGHCELSRVVLVPEWYNCVLRNELGSPSVMLKKASEGELTLTEDVLRTEELPDVFQAPSHRKQAEAAR